MATSFFNGAFFGGEFFNSSPTPSPTPTQTPAGKSKKRRWIVGDRAFYGTYDEAQSLAESQELPAPVRQKKAQQKPVRRAVQDEIQPLSQVNLQPLQPLDFGLLLDQVAAEQMNRLMSERMQLLAKQMQDDDDEDVMLLLM